MTSVDRTFGVAVLDTGPGAGLAFRFEMIDSETMVCHQTSVGSLPRAAFSAVTRPGAM
jgi:hypothetical protein